MVTQGLERDTAKICDSLEATTRLLEYRHLARIKPLFGLRLITTNDTQERNLEHVLSQLEGLKKYSFQVGDKSCSVEIDLKKIEYGYDLLLNLPENLDFSRNTRLTREAWQKILSIIEKEYTKLHK